MKQRKLIRSKTKKEGEDPMAKTEKTGLAVNRDRYTQMMVKVRSPAFEDAYTKTLPMTLRRHMPVDKAINTVGRAVQKNEKLLACDPRTIQQALIDSAVLGLELAGPLHHACIVPYYNSKKGITEAQMQMEYPGFLELMSRTGKFDGSPIVQWVFEKDHFVMDVAKRDISHRPYLDGDRGMPKLVYIISHFKTGGFHFDYMTYDQILAHRERYIRKDRYGNWPDTWDDVNNFPTFLEMGRKTMIRRAQKHLPKSVEDEAMKALAKASEFDGLQEMGTPEHIVQWADMEVPAVPREEEPKTSTTRTGAVLEKLRQRESDGEIPPKQEFEPTLEAAPAPEAETEPESMETSPEPSQPPASPPEPMYPEGMSADEKRAALFQLEEMATKVPISAERVQGWKSDLNIRVKDSRTITPARLSNLRTLIENWEPVTDEEKPQEAAGAVGTESKGNDMGVHVLVDKKAVDGLIDRIRGLMGWEGDDARKWMERVLEEELPNLQAVTVQQADRLEAVLDQREMALSQPPEGGGKSS